MPYVALVVWIGGVVNKSPVGLIRENNTLDSRVSLIILLVDDFIIVPILVLIVVDVTFLAVAKEVRPNGDRCVTDGIRDGAVITVIQAGHDPDGAAHDRLEGLVEIRAPRGGRGRLRYRRDRPVEAVGDLAARGIDGDGMTIGV